MRDGYNGRRSVGVWFGAGGRSGESL